MPRSADPIVAGRFTNRTVPDLPTITGRRDNGSWRTSSTRRLPTVGTQLSYSSEPMAMYPTDHLFRGARPVGDLEARAARVGLKRDCGVAKLVGVDRWVDARPSTDLADRASPGMPIDPAAPAVDATTSRSCHAGPAADRSSSCSLRDTASRSTVAWSMRIVRVALRTRRFVIVRRFCRST